MGGVSASQVIDARAKVEKATSEEEILQIWSHLFKSFKTKNLKEVHINNEWNWIFIDNVFNII